MTRHFPVSLIAAVAAASAFISATRATTQAPTDHAGQPTLVVLLVVDQLRADYLDRYGTHWSGGLKRLMNEGAWYRNAAYPYLSTVTCPGHATIGTGRFPRSHGIVMNSWLDREIGKTTDCTGDPSASLVTAEGQTQGGDSAWRLRGPTFAEKVKGAGGRVVSISAKGRSAIMLAGKKADAVVWFGGRGEFVTSSAYSRELPEFVRSTLKSAPILEDRTKTWTRLLPAENYVGPDDAQGERTPSGWTSVFPHSLDQPQFLGLWQVSPWEDAYLTRLATAAIDEYKLGQGPKADFLSVSFSALDAVGHSYGPNSHEVQDIVARLDQQIGILLSHLDEKVGRNKYVVAFTADHGVADIPEQALSSGQDSGRLDMNAIRVTIERALRPLFGRGTTPAVAGILYTDVYLMPGVPERMSERHEALGIVKKALANVPGIARVFGEGELGRVDDRDPVQRAAALSHYRGRSGDIILIPKRGWIASSAGTTHGTQYDYDQRVPVIFLGGPVGAGRFDDAVTPADIVPTLARLTGVSLSDTDGHALPVEATKTASAPRKQENR